MIPSEFINFVREHINDDDDHELTAQGEFAAPASVMGRFITHQLISPESADKVHRTAVGSGVYSNDAIGDGLYPAGFALQAMHTGGSRIGDKFKRFFGKVGRFLKGALAKALPAIANVAPDLINAGVGKFVDRFNIGDSTANALRTLGSYAASIPNQIQQGNSAAAIAKNALPEVFSAARDVAPTAANRIMDFAESRGAKITPAIRDRVQGAIGTAATTIAHAGQSGEGSAAFARWRAKYASKKTLSARGAGVYNGVHVKLISPP